MASSTFDEKKNSATGRPLVSPNQPDSFGIGARDQGAAVLRLTSAEAGMSGGGVRGEPVPVIEHGSEQAPRLHRRGAETDETRVESTHLPAGGDCPRERGQEGIHRAGGTRSPPSRSTTTVVGSRARPFRVVRGQAEAFADGGGITSSIPSPFFAEVGMTSSGSRSNVVATDKIASCVKAST